MKSEIKCSGVLSIRNRRTGEVILDVPNLILNGAISTAGDIDSTTADFYTFTDTSANYEDLDGTWNQSGNTVTRASGSGTFPSSPSQIGNELKWEDGERCHVTARVSDTSITVSGPARTITGKTIRRYRTNISSISGSSQNKTSGSAAAASIDLTAGTWQRSWSVIFDAASVGYTLGSVIVRLTGVAAARIVLPVPVAVEESDQLEMTYTLQKTVGNRTPTTVPISGSFTGWPYRFQVNSIVGNGTSFDIVTNEAHNFLAGDEIEVVEAIPLRHEITAITADGTEWTVTAPSHGLSPADTCVIEDCTVTGYNGTHTVASAPDANTITITNATSPGSATDGTVRLATPGSYFSGPWTVDSIPDSSTIRVTSDRQGPAVDPSTGVRGKDEMTWHVWGGFGGLSATQRGVSFNEANEKSPPAVTSTSSVDVTGNSHAGTATTGTFTNASYTNDFQASMAISSAQQWSAGGADVSRVKQIMRLTTGPNSSFQHLFTFTTPQPKLSAYRLGYPVIHQKITRDLPNY